MVNKLQNTIEYFSKLLNINLDQNTEITLSSAQKSRAHAWLKSQNIPFQEHLIQKKFTLNLLLNNNGFTPLEANPRTHQETIIDNEVAGTFLTSIGIDLQNIYELFPNSLSNDLKGDAELGLIFTNRELTYAENKANPKATLAGIFAAKEAILKTGVTNTPLEKIEVSHNSIGAPEFKGVSLSISHSGDYAIAIAIPPIYIGKPNIYGASQSTHLDLKADDAGFKANSQPLALNWLNSIVFWKIVSLALMIVLLFLLIN